MFYENFLDKLGTWEMGVPLQSLWVVIVSFPKEIEFWLNKQQNSQLDYAGWREFSSRAYSSIIGSEFNNGGNDEYITGCLFARTVNIPGEKIETTNNFSMQNGGGLMFPSITTNRSSLPLLDISFLETNSSFVDFGIRPWCIAASYAGTVARKQGNVKGSIQAIFYAKTDFLQERAAATDGDKKNYQQPTLQNNKLAKRKIFEFYDVIPLNVNNQEYSYLGDAVHSRSIQFLYSSYSVATADTPAKISSS